MPSIFSKIVKGELSAYKVAEDERFLAFLDIFPLAKGHMLIIPKKETDYIFDLDSKEFVALWCFAQLIAKAMEKVIPCERIGIAVIGLEVAHAHIHLVPLTKGVSNINFEKQKLKFTQEEFEEIAQKIRREV
jgi:histidine triad (HIT) family protein|tara:strand:+ start:2951 stop:3346 length:396 start_codon:yes stop_codon:yes gene_type:complete